MVDRAWTKPSTALFSKSLWSILGLHVGLLIVFSFACETASARTPVQATPNKAELIRTLYAILPLLEQEKFNEAAKHVVMPTGLKPEDLASLVKNNEIALAGIKRLESDAKFGRATDLFGAERGAYFAKKMNVDLDECYGFNHETEQATAEVIAFWDTNQFKLIRLDDVGKIGGNKTSPESGEAPPEKQASVGKMPSPEQLRAALPAIQKAAEQNPNDVGAQAKYAMVLFQVGSLPSSWKQLMKARKLQPDHGGVARGVDALIDAFTHRDVFSVGIPTETIAGILGEPAEKVDLGEDRQRWIYAHWGIDFESNRIHEVINLRGASEALFQPTEIVNVDLDGRGWRCGYRLKKKGRVVAYYFVPGQSLSDHREMFSIERLLRATAFGTMQEIAEKTIKDEAAIVKGANHKILLAEEDTVVIASKLPGPTPQETQHNLIRLFKGPQDIHRISYMVKSEKDPSAETQKKWMEIFKSANIKKLK